MKVPILIIFIWLWASCLESSNALFFKALKGLKHGYNSGGYGSYPTGYSNNYYGNYGGYGGYAGSGNYGGYGSYGGSGGYGSYGGYGGYSRPVRSRQRTGRTYSDIANVLAQDKYLGLGAGRYLPNAPYSHLWG